MFIKNKLYSNDIEPSCSYCVNGKLSSDNKSILCIKKGVVTPFYSCNKFKYDITKREPKPMLKLKTYNEEDFSL